MKVSLAKAFVILWKDILSELRSRDIATSVLVFALLVILLDLFVKQKKEMLKLQLMREKFI